MSSIRKRPDGKWRARYRDEQGKEHSKHFARRTDGIKWLEEVASSVRTGTYVDPQDGRMTLATFFADWSKRQVWAGTTVVAMELAVRKCDFAKVEFSRLRRSHVEAYVKRMVDDGLAPGTIRTRMNNVRTALRAAVRDRYLTADPSDGVVLPRLRKTEHAMQVPSLEDVGALLEAADDWFKTYIALCAFAGMRRGEAAGVQVGDVRFLERSVYIHRQVQRGVGSVAIVPPKHGSERVVPVPDELLTLLARHVDVIGVHGAEGWLFVGEGGMPPHENTIAYWWRKTQRDAGLSGLKLHSLRHFYVSGLIADGCDVVTVQKALGHHSATVTLGTYSHLWPNAEDRTRNAAAGLFRSATAARADQMRTKRA